MLQPGVWSNLQGRRIREAIHMDIFSPQLQHVSDILYQAALFQYSQLFFLIFP